MNTVNIKVVPESQDDPFNGFGLLIIPSVKNQNNKNGNNFSAIVETLERIGRVDKYRKTITQTVYVVAEGADYSLMHFRELYARDRGEDVLSVSKEDIRERNYVANILYQWNMIELEDEDKIQMVDEGLFSAGIGFIPYSEKADYDHITRYSFSVAKRNKESAA